jgi:hypothetical protein
MDILRAYQLYHIRRRAFTNWVFKYVWKLYNDRYWNKLVNRMYLLKESQKFYNF